MAGNHVRIRDLEAGDVLLYRPTDSWKNVISKMIRMIDGGEVSHAGIYLGDGQVGEALIAGNSGVNRNSVEVSFDGCDWVAVRRLPGKRNDLRPVLAAATTMLDQKNRYAYEQILLLAVLLLTRKVKLENPILRKIITTTMDKANRWLSAMLGEGREPMICSEFVYRCYDQADERDEDPYSLLIGGGGPVAAQGRFMRRRRHAASPAAAAQAPTIHPESLMARLANNPPKLAMQAGPAAAAPADETAAQPDPELIALIKAYEASEHSPVGKAMQAPAAAAAPDIDEVEAKAGEFAQLLQMTKAPMQAAAYGGVEDGPTEVIRTISDFVTPADLWRTGSLSSLGAVYPGR
ncbi:hypothetical protein Pan44_10300 [Caulifigura coniformis]|uniref:Uncharacterized protein n=1 Tax=Caulifigura coniformis TaxID=2527983 RepID=A0A517SA45_9PLAN|nr:hypothetical protein [Caulifigura coniformis]QDT53015.1 hypothetical protein Pan44_10300 [Caulifigura coniformis]